jgi:copper(I)-binding protein
LRCPSVTKPTGAFHSQGEIATKRHLVTLAALLMASTAFAHEITVGDLQIIHANIPAPMGSAQVAAGYMGISNEGDQPDTLVGIEVGFAAKGMLHTTEFSADGVARMKHVEALEIPAGDTVVLEPGGYHIMLMGLTQPLNVGDMMPATLIFERGGRVEIEFMVDPSDGSVDHSKMHHSAMGQETPAQTTDAGADIEALLRAQFETPEAPLTVAPISVHGPVAIAGWAQDGRGGRAFLRQDDKGWFIELCSGASLMLPASLQSLGLSAAEAEALLTQAKAAEAVLTPGTIALLDSFDGTLIVGRDDR